MRTKHFGASCLEISLVLVVLIVVIIITAPMWLLRGCGGHHNGARQTTCTSNLRQLSMAVTMYSQDNKLRLPGLYKRLANGSLSPTYTGWAGDIITYIKGGTDVITSSEMMFCPEMISDLEMPICYGYNASLLNADGTGVSEKAIKQPTQVGLLCDVNPGIPFPAVTSSEKGNIYGGGGIVGGASMIFSNVAASEAMGAKLAVTPVGRHHGSVIVGYADGHAAAVPDINNFDVKDSQSGVVRAFYMATALGLVDNSAAGLGGAINQPFGNITPAEKGKTMTYIGGDPVTRPILAAASEVAKKMRTGFKYKVYGFNGSLDGNKRPSDYLEGVVAGIAPSSVGGQVSRVQIGVDAMVAIVNKNCTINTGTIDLTKQSFNRSGGVGKWRLIKLNDLQTIIQSDGYGINKKNDWQLYLQNKADRSRVTIAGSLSEVGFGAYYKDGGTVDQAGYVSRTIKGSKSDADTFRGVYCRNDCDIVDKVANDVLGIGIVSAAFADQKKVDILAIEIGPSNTFTFPTSVKSQNPGVYPPSCTWPFRRNLYAYYTPGKASETVANLSFVTYKSAFNESPFYKASYWR